MQLSFIPWIWLEGKKARSWILQVLNSDSIPHIKDFHPFLLPEESSTFTVQILTVTAYDIYFFSNHHKLNLLCKRETRWATFSFGFCKSSCVSHCLPWVQLSSVIFGEKMALSYTSCRSVQRCCLKTRLLHSRAHRR